MFYNSIVISKLLIFFPNLVDHFHALGDDVKLVIFCRLHQTEGAETLTDILGDQPHGGLPEGLIDLGPASPGERWQLESEGNVQPGPVSSGLSLLLNKPLGINTESFLLAGLKYKYFLDQSSLFSRGSGIFIIYLYY